MYDLTNLKYNNLNKKRTPGGKSVFSGKLFLSKIS